MTNDIDQKQQFYLGLIKSGKIRCTTSGEVWNATTEKKLGYRDDSGVLSVNWQNPETKKWSPIKVHRLIWLAFKGIIPKGLTPVPKDGDYNKIGIDNLTLKKVSEVSKHRQKILPETISQQKRQSAAWDVPEEKLRVAIAGGDTFQDVLAEVGLSHGSSAKALRRRVKELGIDISHLSGRGFHRGRSSNALPLEDVLCKDSQYTGMRARITYKRLKSIKYKCAECPLTDEWNGKPLVLTLDHRNGDNRDHRPSNIRWLCPNCHSQTLNFCGRNKNNPLRRSSRKREKN